MAYIKNSTGSDKIRTLGWYVLDVNTTTVGGAASSPCYVVCRHAGSASLHPGAVEIP